MDSSKRHEMFLTLADFFTVFKKEVLDYVPGNNDPMLSPMLYRSLQMIHLDKTLVPSLLSERLAIPPTNTSRIIRKLVELGYVTKTRDEHDKRITHLSLTDSGIAMVGKSYEILEASLFEKFKVLSPEELKHLFEAITVCRDLFSKVANANKS